MEQQTRDVHGFPEFQSAILRVECVDDPCTHSEEQEHLFAKTLASFEFLKDLIAAAIEMYCNVDCWRGPEDRRSKVEVVAYRISFWCAINNAINELNDTAKNSTCVKVVVAETSCTTGVLVSAMGTYLGDPDFRFSFYHGWDGSHKVVHRHATKPASLAQDVRDLLAVVPGLPHVSPADLGVGELDRVPVNSVNIAIVQTMLDALPNDYYTDDYHGWFGVACVLHSFDSGEIGFALFKKFSARCPTKAADGNISPEDQWARISNGGYTVRRRTIGSLVRDAKANGWNWPRPWDLTSTGWRAS